MTVINQTLDGYVIGGNHHGERHDPERYGEVLRLPNLLPVEPLPTFADYVPTRGLTYASSQYRLHTFHWAHAYGTHVSYRLWFPADVDDRHKIEHLILTALQQRGQE